MVEYGEPIDPTVHSEFTKVPDWLARRSELPWGAKAVYARLGRYYDRSLGHAYPGKGALSTELGMSVRSVFDCLDRLAVAGLIRIVHRGRYEPSVYEILHHPWRSEAVKSAKFAEGQAANFATRDANFAANGADTFYKKKTSEETTLASGLAEIAHTGAPEQPETDAARALRRVNPREEATMTGAFLALWREHVGERAAKALTARQLRDALDLWNRAIEIGRGELVEEAVRRTATRAETNRWAYFAGTLAGMLRDAQPAPIGEQRSTAVEADRFRHALARHQAGEQINPLVLAEAVAWEREQQEGRTGDERR